MLDLRAEVRQSRGEVKPRNVRWRCQKTTTSKRAVAVNIAKLPESPDPVPVLSLSDLCPLIPSPPSLVSTDCDAVHSSSPRPVSKLTSNDGGLPC
jgi:hypothetical protein